MNWQDYDVVMDDAGSSLPYSTVWIRALSRADALWRVEHRSRYDVNRVVSIGGEPVAQIRERVNSRNRMIRQGKLPTNWPSA